MTLHHKRYWLLVAYISAALPFIGQGAIRALSSNANSPLDWVPGTFGPRKVYDEFRAQFGPGDAVLMSWPGCRINDARLDRLAGVLRTGREFFDENGNWYFHGVTTGREAVAALERPPVGLSRDEAASRLKGTLVGKDGASTCLVVTFTARGLKERGRLVGRLRAAAHHCCNVAPDNLRLVGPVIDGLTVDRLSKRALDVFAIPSALVILFVCYMCLGSIRGALLVLSLSLLGQSVTLSLVYYAGDQMSSLLIVMPPLIQVLAIAGGIHLVNYYVDARDEFGPGAAATHAIRAGWLPCVLSAGTTALGLISLTTSELTPIRAFGVYGSAGVLITTGLLLALIPGTLLVWPISIGSKSSALKSLARKEQQDAWSRLAATLSNSYGIVAFLGVGVMVLVGWGMSRITTSVRVETLFSKDSRILSDYRWIEERIGPSVPIEILLTFDRACDMPFRERLGLVARVTRDLANMDEIGGITSPLSFIPRFPRPPDVTPDLYYQRVDEMLQRCKPVFAELDAIGRSNDREILRITASLSALDAIDYGQVLSTLRTEIAPALRDAQGRPLDGVEASLTGIMPLVHAIQRQLMQDLAKSFLAAVGTITLVMTLVQGSIVAGLVAMVPNVFPILLMFGGLGWLHVPVDIGSVMTASIALGVAVDDTLHYLTFYRRGLGQGMTRPEAVLFAYRHCGRAMVQTSLACGLGMLSFAFSDFVPTSRFAGMMSALLMIALFADLVLLPALLLGPLGRVFCIAQPPAQQMETPTPVETANELVRPRRISRDQNPTGRTAGYPARTVSGPG